MRFCAPWIAAVLLFGGVAREAVAFDLPIFSDNFDSYADQAAFVAEWPRYSGAAAPIDATLTTAQSVSTPKSVSFVPGVVNGEQRHRHAITAEDYFAGERLVWSFDIRESGFIGNPQRVYMGLHSGAATATNQLVQMGANNNQFSADGGGNFYMARILGFTPCTTAGCDPDGGPPETTAGAGSFFKLNDFGNAGLRTPGNTWRNLKVEISFGGELGTGVHYQFFVNDVLAERVTNVGTAHRIFDTISLGSGLLHSTNTFFIDNMELGIFFEAEVDPGDINEDGFVNILDYVAGRTEDEPGTGQPLLDWAQYYTGNLSGTGTAQNLAVPEPASIALLAAGLAAVVAARRRLG